MRDKLLDIENRLTNLYTDLNALIWEVRLLIEKEDIDNGA